MEQTKAAKDIMSCRTSDLGGHAYECETCGHWVIRYNSCRNRHCPHVKESIKKIWVDNRKKDILDAPYFHVVFTMPEQLHMLIYHNQKLLYDLMYKTVAETLMSFPADKKYLGAQIGFFSVLHTWGQNLHYHPHIHSVVLAGGLIKQNQCVTRVRNSLFLLKYFLRSFVGNFSTI